MAQAKIELTLGPLSFSGEAEEDWLSKQLDKVLAAAPGLAKGGYSPTKAAELPGPEAGATTEQFTETLPSHIKAKGGESNQVVRFIATADWLRRRGNPNLATGMVSKALQDNHQKRLSNPADCLNKNVAKGYCEKKDDGFFITPDGLKALGYE